MNYKVGDKVIIKKWEDMVKEFGFDIDGNIKTEIRFVDGMRRFCGREVQIALIIQTEQCAMFLVKGGGGYGFSEDTFERSAGESKATTTATAKAGMTFREKLAQEHPECIGKRFEGGCKYCPHDYGYEGKGHLPCGEVKNCTECWNRVIPETVAEPAKTKPKSKYFNGKVKCIKTDYDWWTVGKVYEVVDGIITADDGGKFPKRDDYRYKDAEDVRHAGCTAGTNYNSRNEFIPVEEEEPKSEYKFKVGETVRSLRNGKLGKVVCIKADESHYGVEFDENVGGHDCGSFELVAGSRGKDNHCLWHNTAHLEKVNQDPNFIPHLLNGGEHFGNIGEPTNYKDKDGKPLYIGDVVERIDSDGESYGDKPIVRSRVGKKEKTFVMGIEMSCDEKKGKTGKWTIIKKRSYEDVANGEKVGNIKYVKEAE